MHISTVLARIKRAVGTSNQLLPWRFRSINNFVLASPNRFFKAVKTTPPLELDPSSDIEIHALVCHRDVNMMLTSAKSLLQYCPPAAMLLHDDGSLTAEDRDLMQTHLVGVRIVTRSEADTALRAALPPEVFEKRSKHFFLLKLLDVNFFGRANRIVLLDSDIIFLRRPDEIIEWMNQPNPVPFYNKDICNSYRASRIPDGVHLPDFLNAGFMGFCGRFTMDRIIECCREVDYWAEDQTIYALLLAGRGARALEPERYRVYMGEPITDRTAMVHFISPKRFEGLLYPRLARRIFRKLRRERRNLA